MIARSTARSGPFARIGWLCAIFLLAMAIHHVAAHDSSGLGHYCPLCILLSSILVVEAGLLLLGLFPAAVPVRVDVETPILSREEWTPWSHRGPPLASSLHELSVIACCRSVPIAWTAAWPSSH